MKKTLLIFLSIALLSCKNKEEKTEQAVEEIPVKMQVVRFEQAFFNSKPTELEKVKTQFPEFFPAEIPNQVWLEKLQNKDWQAMYSEVEKKYHDFSAQQTEIESLFKHIKYYFKNVQTPQIVTLIGEMDYNNKVIYAQNKLLIALEMYLGSTHKFYSDVPEYISQNFNQKQLLPDAVTAFSRTINPTPKTKELLGEMIYYGKELYLKDLLIPNYSNAEKIGYTDVQQQFCQENEYYIWSYFIEKQLLYSTDPKLPGRFINLGPFSKFYLEIDNDTPGRVGQWMGWQIVKSYAENHPETKPEQLLQLDAKTLFEQSKYKPKQNE